MGAEGKFAANQPKIMDSVGKIKNIAKIMVRVERVKTNKYMSEEVNKYPEDIVILEERDMTWWLLKNVGS